MKRKKVTSARGAKIRSTKKQSLAERQSPKKSDEVHSPKDVSIHGKTRYTPEELQYFKTIILDKKKEIIEELQTLRDSMVDATTGEYKGENSSYSTHMEQGTDTMEREKVFLFASREVKFLNYLENALKRIENGVYGICTVCGKLIEKGRLEAVPHSQQCFNCKTQKPK